MAKNSRGVTTGLDIKVARIRARLTQQELAELLFVDRAIVSRIENDRMAVSEGRLMAIAKITGVEIVGRAKETENY